MALLISCSDGVLREADLSTLPSLDPEVESYEADFPLKILHGRVPKLSTAATASNARLPGGGPAAAQALEKKAGDEETKSGVEEAEEKESAPAPEEEKKEDEPVSYESLKVDSACYVASEVGGPTKPRLPGDAVYQIYTGVTSQSNRSYLLEFDAMLGEPDTNAMLAEATLPGATVSANNEEVGDEEAKEQPETEEEEVIEVDPNRALKFGVYTPDGRHNTLKTPKTASVRYSNSGSYLLCGTDDGSVILRPRAQDATFIRMPAHNGRVTFAATRMMTSL